MAITDWQVWLNILLAWSIIAPGKSRAFPFRSWLETDGLIQFTGSPSSCRRSSEDLDTRLPSQTFLLFHRMPSPVGSSRKLPDDFTDDDLLLAIVLVLFSHFSDKLRLRWPFILAGFLTCAVGFGINLSDASNGVKYFGTFLCVIGSYSCCPGLIAW